MCAPVAFATAAACHAERSFTIDPVFVDTNVLVYARDSSDPRRQATAASWLEELWRSRTGRISSQVLQEYYVIVTRKLRPGLPEAMARDDVRALAEWEPIPAGVEVMERAWELEQKHKLSFWDAMIVAAAVSARATTLLTEDLQDGAEIAGVRIVNPFRSSPSGDRIHDGRPRRRS